MAKEKKKDENNEAETKPPAADETKTLDPVQLKIGREHIVTPHSVELRKDENGFVADARTEDHAHTYTVGAKTVEQILRDAGAELPAADEEELILTFSPHNGELIAVAAVEKTAE